MFCDSEDVKFDPLEIHSQFNHVFVVVVPAGKSPAGKQLYRISIVRKFGVPAIEPKLTYPAVYEEGDIFREMFLTKLINSERLSMYAPDFVRKMYRTRKELMNVLIKDVKTKKSSRFTSVLGNTMDRISSMSDGGSKRGSTSSSSNSGGGGGGEAGASGGGEGGSRRGHQRGRSLGRLVGTIGKKDGTRGSRIEAAGSTERKSKIF